MALGVLLGSMVNLALNRISPLIVIVVTPSFATRLPVATIASGIGCPSAWPETIDHSPWSCDISFCVSIGASAVKASAIAAIRAAMRRMRTPQGDEAFGYTGFIA